MLNRRGGGEVYMKQKSGCDLLIEEEIVVVIVICLIIST